MTHKGDMGPPCGQLVGPCGSPIFLLVVSPDDFFSSCSSISPKNDVAKRLGRVEVRKVPESQKLAKHKEICFTVLKPNGRGLFRTPPPQSLENKSKSS
jgi:hypothetical protein